ncbi:MAG: Sterol 3-beta-glucosyltransferase [Watsoniomyces obsoletus]|nr:MAG: Sterol 3-beta-glucosyltransferase [Watsoniomyces obsoletus]
MTRRKKNKTPRPKIPQPLTNESEEIQDALATPPTLARSSTLPRVLPTPPSETARFPEVMEYIKAMFLYDELHPTLILKMLERWPGSINGVTMYRMTEEQWVTYFGPYGIHLFAESQQVVQHLKGMGGYSTIHAVLTTGTLYFVRDSAVVQKALAAISFTLWAIYALLTYFGARPHSRFYRFVPSFFRGKK